MKMRTIISLLIVLSIVSTLTPITSSAQNSPVYMYWVDISANKIQRAELDGSNVQDILTGSGRPVDIAVDIASGKIYWTDRDRADHTDPAGRSIIQRANLDGTNVEILVIDNVPAKENIALDIPGGKMYWTDWDGMLRRANLDGTNVEDLVTGLGGPRGVDLDISKGKVYWASSMNTTSRKIYRANLDGSNVQDLLTADNAHGIALDAAGSKIYWANLHGKIQRANLDGSNLEDIVVGLNQPFGIALDSLSGKVYWADNLAGKIQRANLDGTNVEDLVTGLIHPIGIALGIPQTTGLRFNPNLIANQTLTLGLGAPVSLTLPMAIGGSPPYTYSTSALPLGLQFDPVDRWLNGTPTTTGTTPVTYTVTDATGAAASLTFTITIVGTPVGQGLVAEVYQPGGSLTQLPDFQALRPVQTFRVLNLNVSMRPCEQGFPGYPGLKRDVIENFAIRFRGHLNIATAGTYNFALSSDDGSRLYINGDLIIDHDGLATPARGNPGRGSVSLPVGLHDVEVQFFQGPCSHVGLQWFWQPPNGTEAIVPTDVLYLRDVYPVQGISFVPNEIVDQIFVVNAPIEPLALPVATGGTAPYLYTLTPLPIGLFFDERAQVLRGVPTTWGRMAATYTTTDTTGADTSLTFTITVQDTPAPTDVYMYWTDHGTNKLQQANLDGTNVQDLLTGSGRPVGIALDLAGGKVYWTDRDRLHHTDPAGRNSIHRANPDGTNVETLVRGGNSVKECIALDVSGGKMYWTEYSHFDAGKVQRANLDGSNVEDLVTNIPGAIGLALDIAQGKIYWTNAGKLRRANLDGSDIEDVLSDYGAHYLALDVAGRKIYWGNHGRNKIQRANLDGTNVEDLVTGLRIPAGLALDITQGKIYWVDRGQGGDDKIQRANLDGTNVEDLVTGLTYGASIALGIPQTPVFRLNPNVIADQTFTVGEAVNLTLPTATGGTAPYTYTLAPTLPVGLSFDPIANGPGVISGTPTAALPPTPFTYTATDAIGASASITLTITVELNLDVNADGTVDVLDLVWVAVSYQMRGDALLADVNADGVVNVQDLVAVANAIDAAAVLPAKVAEDIALAAEAAVALRGAAGAPGITFSSRSQRVSRLTTYHNVNAALADVRALESSDVQFGKWLPLLERLLQVLAEIKAIPETTALLPNYPNPFNPETWIPYQLSTPSTVTLSIYSVDGRLVRTLVLGHQPVGVYQSKHRAAYWDGRNQHGEPVASGLYFYTLTAGGFNTTRKLFIAK